MKKLIVSTAVVAAMGMGVSTQASAALTNGDILHFNAATYTYSSILGASYVSSGSYFGMDANGNGSIDLTERMGLVQNNGIILGTAQGASGSHSGAPNGTETLGIDQPWEFLGNTGMDYTSSATNVLSSTGNTATVDLSGWTVTWNGIAAIPMGSGAWNGNADGVADLTCGSTCGVGDTYTLDYSATVPLNDPSGFGGVAYALHLVGTVGAAQVSAVPVPAAAWLFGSGLLGLIGIARRRKAAH